MPGGFFELLNAYWVERRAISMSRDVLVGLGWTLEGVAAKLPRESLRDTLEATARVLPK